MFVDFEAEGFAGVKRIAAEMGVGVGTIYRIALEGAKFVKRFLYFADQFSSFCSEYIVSSACRARSMKRTI